MKARQRWYTSPPLCLHVVSLILGAVAAAEGVDSREVHLCAQRNLLCEEILDADGAEHAQVVVFRLAHIV